MERHSVELFPPTPFFSGVNAPSRAEVDIDRLVIEGEIPAEIDGAFYRAASDHQFAPRFHDDIPFNGDGMISRFRFKGGKVSLKTRYARSERFLRERAAGRALMGKYRNRHLDEPGLEGVPRDLANTSVLIHGGVLLAFWEGALPIALDPFTMETIGRWDFLGTYKHPTCSAHCAIDPTSGNLVGFAFATKGEFTRDAVYFEADPSGRIVHEVEFELPYFAELHDCGITRDYIVFPVVPIIGVGEEGLKRGETYYHWDSLQPIHLGVMPRFGKAEDLRWFTAPNQFTSHKMNAWNEGTKVHFDTCVSPGNLFPFFPEKGKQFDFTKANVKLTRWTVDMASNSDAFESATTLSNFQGEFPKMDDRYAMGQYRHGWLLGFGGTIRNSMGHVDLETGETQVWDAGPTKVLQEPVFIPRPGGSEEGDGWVAQAATDTESLLTELNLFEAKDIARGPIATVKTPVHLKPAYHGNWFDASVITPSGLV